MSRRDFSISFQSSLPRGERHKLLRGSHTFNSISILAPARGATSCAAGYEPEAHISILAPARGATQSARARRSTSVHFNPRSREGSDCGDRIGYSIGIISILAPARGATPTFTTLPILTCISILAPARGATNPIYIISSTALISILAPARGATTEDQAGQMTLKEFQSSLPRGERHLITSR